LLRHGQFVPTPQRATPEQAVLATRDQ